MTALHLITRLSLGGPAQNTIDSVVAMDRAGFARIRVTNSPLSGPDHSAGRGTARWAAVASVVSGVAIGGTALTAGRLLLSPSILAFAEREGG
jgi:hypothetical protein